MEKRSVDQSPGKSSSSDDEIFIGPITAKEKKKHEDLMEKLRIMEKRYQSPDKSSSSDDEIFIGPMSLKEAKKHKVLKKKGTFRCIETYLQTHSGSNVIIIKAISEPDLLAATNSIHSKSPKSSSSATYTPEKEEPACTPHLEVLTTPLCPKKKLLKTPDQPIATKRVMSGKKTPSKTLAFQHIASPVAAYINQGPQVPLIQNVTPTKPLNSCISIPKLQDSQTPKASNKEFVNLPTLAYKSAKKTGVIKLPEEKVMPCSQWAKKIKSSIPVVLKHEHREMDFSRKPPASPTDDSFADLPCNQADLSFCTQKSATMFN